MTTVYFVRHCEPVRDNFDDRNRSLTEEGQKDSWQVFEFFKGKKVDLFFSSPYTRSFKTIEPAADFYKMQIKTDERFCERKAGQNGNNHEMFKKRWSDKTFAEPGGESLSAVQKRNIEALFDVLENNAEKTIVIGTHGTALSCILNYFDSTFNCDSFLRIIDFMPYIIRFDFEGDKLLKITEELYVKKDFKKS